MDGNVICNGRDNCIEAPQCGAAKPHQMQEEECGMCNFDKKAQCIPIAMDEKNDAQASGKKILALVREQKLHVIRLSNPKIDYQSALRNIISDLHTLIEIELGD